MVLHKRNGYNAIKIYNFFTEYFCSNLILNSTNTKSIRSESFPIESSQTKNCFSFPDFKKDQKIQQALDENSFLSVREISSAINIAPSTVLLIITMNGQTNSPDQI